MSVHAPCPGCEVGDHTRHEEQWEQRSHDLIGGSYCGCPGDCVAPDFSWLKPSAVVADLDRTHRHWFALHRHPDWHGHCRIFHYGLSRTEFQHSCRRWHFHLPFKHRHTPSGR